MSFFRIFVFYSVFIFVIIFNIVAFTGLILSKTNPELSTYGCYYGNRGTSTIDYYPNRSKEEKEEARRFFEEWRKQVIINGTYKCNLLQYNYNSIKISILLSVLISLLITKITYKKFQK